MQRRKCRRIIMHDGSGSGGMDVPSEPLGNFYWSMREHNFIAARTLFKRNGQEGEAVVPLLPECELEAHDLYQTKFDYPLGFGMESHDVNC